jgi:hypothetical protein
MSDMEIFRQQTTIKNEAQWMWVEQKGGVSLVSQNWRRSDFPQERDWRECHPVIRLSGKASRGLLTVS